MTKEHQIGCNLRREEGRRLTQYAGAHELSRPKLCALLILRELKGKRLELLKAQYGRSEPKKGAVRVTARIASANLKADFASAAAALGLGSDDAAAILFRAELEECWLTKALAT